MVKLRAIWEQNLTGLEATGMFDVERFCTVLAIRNMTPEVHHEWAKYIKGHDGIPPIKVFKDFLTEQNYSSYHPKPYKSFCSSHYWRFYIRILCAVWGESSHPLYFCSVFKSTPAQQKLGLVRKSSACNNCLNFGHKTRDCKSRKRCRHCGSKHYSSLHLNNARKPNTSGTTPNSETSETVAAASVNSLLVDTSTTTELNSSLLMTAEIIITSDHGKRVKIRALLDTGSSASLLTNCTAIQLGLQKIRQTTRIMGIQGNPAKPSNYLAVFSAETTYSEKMVKITAALVDNITHNLSAHPIYGTEDWEVTCNLHLADSSFHKPGHIDALVGMDILSDVLLNGLHTGKPTEPKAFNTVFGWAVAGQYQDSPVQAPTSLHVVCEAGEDLDTGSGSLKKHLPKLYHYLHWKNKLQLTRFSRQSNE